MTFLHTTLAAAGLAAVAIPIIIHLLFRQRRKPLPWAAMRFLLEAMRKQRKRLRLETLILLAVRCLLLACLAAAIARPIFAGAGLFGSTAGRDVYLLIDNSIASALRTGGIDANGTAASGDTNLTWHLKKARLVLESLGASDRAGLMFLGAPADASVVPASSDPRAVAGLLEGVTPTDSASDLAGALDRLGATIRSERAGVSSGTIRPVSIYILSAFTSGAADVSRPLPGALQGLEDVSIIAEKPAENVQSGNVQIVALQPLRSVVIAARAAGASGTAAQGEASQVRVLLRRTGSAVGTSGVTAVRVAASASGVMTAASSSGTVRWSAGQSEGSVTVQLEAGVTESGGKESVLVAEIDRDALANDNVRRRPVEVRDRLQVGVVAQRTFGSAGRADQLSSAEWFRLALRPGESSPIEVVDIEPSALDTPALALLDAVVLPSPDLLKDDAWTKIRRFADAGGLVIVSPPEGASVHLWADAFTKSMGLPWRIAREASNAPPDAAARLAEQAPGVVPGAGSDGGTIFALLSQELQQLARPVTITRWLGVQTERGGATALLSLADGTPWLIAGRVGSEAAAGDTTTPKPSGAAEATPAKPSSTNSGGLVVMLASAPVLAWTDLPARPLMVPLVQETVRQGVGEAGATLAAIAGRGVGVPSGTTELRAVENPSAASNAPAARIAIDSAGAAAATLRTSGVWRASDAAGRSRGLVVVNPDADGARLEAQAPEAVRAWLAGAIGSNAGEQGAQNAAAALASVTWMQDTGSAIGAPGAADAASKGRSAWTLPLFIAALSLAFLEVFLARWFSHAKVETASGASSPRATPSLDDLMSGPGGSTKGAAA
jgi:hypothetical protein